MWFTIGPKITLLIISSGTLYVTNRLQGQSTSIDFI